jgi:cytidylyltransferase family
VLVLNKVQDKEFKKLGSFFFIVSYFYGKMLMKGSEDMKQRVISAIVAIIIVVPIVLYGGIPFYLGASVLGLIGFYEMLKARKIERDIPNIMKLVCMFAFIIIMMDNWGNKVLVFNSNDKLILSILLTVIPIVFFNKKKSYDINDALFMLGTIMFLGISFNHLVNIRVGSLYNFIYLVLITTMTDTFAYFTGRLIGKHKMCPSVSPNKTWEGFIGGLVFGTIISVVFYVCAFDFTGSVFLLVLVSMLLSVVGQLGDLVFSSIKRHYKIKDYGNIMPGHGGVLDRLDSLLFVILVFTYLSKFI